MKTYINTIYKLFLPKLRPMGHMAGGLGESVNMTQGQGAQGQGEVGQ